MQFLLVKAFLTLFVVIDPIGLTPIFLSLTERYSPTERLQVARRAVLVAAVILLVFAFIGRWVLRYLGISLESFQVAAGILLLKIAIDMVFARQERETAEEEKEAQLREDISVFPLAIPLLAGPGTLASMLILVGDAASRAQGLLLVLGMAAIVLLIAYVALCLSQRLADVLGKTGVNVITRVFGILLAALAVQYVEDGAIVLLRAAFQP